MFSHSASDAAICILTCSHATLFSYEMQPWDNEMSASLVPDFDKGEVRERHNPCKTQTIEFWCRFLYLLSGSGQH
jgi:hypothetical protein